METPRAAKIDELDKVIELVESSFGDDEVVDIGMKDKYTLFLGKNNIDNIRVVADDNAVASTASYYRSKILCEGCPIEVASIGAVCTKPSYRGKRLASALLEDIEFKTKKEGVDVLLISGNRSLYLRRNCSIVGCFVECELTGEEAKEEIGIVNVIEYNNCPSDLIPLYMREATRYYRSRDEFESYISGTLLKCRNTTNKIVFLENKGVYAAYMVIKINHEDQDNAEVVEYAGDRDLICRAMHKLVKEFSLEYIDLYASVNDPIVSKIKDYGINGTSTNQLGTVKIINFVSLMNNLRPYFRQYVRDEDLNAITFEEKNGAYAIVEGNNRLEIKELNLVNNLVFGSAQGEPDLSRIFENVHDKSVIKRFVKAVFPVALPWAGNLNYV